MTVDVSTHSSAVVITLPDLAVSTHSAYVVILPGNRLAISSQSAYVVLVPEPPSPPSEGVFTNHLHVGIGIWI